ncbi:type II toxin-antitoxin system RelE/ParE family toxin [Nonomuraea sp. NPDC050783]|uniref:type II toxin-antitoxin system RelE family toxin n=1 Tax=Nonomuraea sp. NPDC050783 TaxID=3154634 RepID=UPI0034664399
MKGYYEILLAAPAVGEIRAIHAHDPVAAKHVIDSLEYLSTDLESGALRAIDEGAGLFKAAVGDVEVLCWVRPEEMNVVVLTVSRHRQPA